MWIINLFIRIVKTLVSIVAFFLAILAAALVVYGLLQVRGPMAGGHWRSRLEFEWYGPLNMFHWRPITYGIALLATLFWPFLTKGVLNLPDDPMSNSVQVVLMIATFLYFVFKWETQMPMLRAYCWVYPDRVQPLHDNIAQWFGFFDREEYVAYLNYHVKDPESKPTEQQLERWKAVREQARSQMRRPSYSVFGTRLRNLQASRKNTVDFVQYASMEAVKTAQQEPLTITVP